MNKNRIVAALAAGAILGTVGAGVVSAPSVAYAEEAGGVDGFSDVPKDHWAYEALDYLAKEGVIEGYGDGTFRGNRTMTRYEMAAIIAKAGKSGTLGGDAILEKLQREFKGEIRTLKRQVVQNTKDIAELKKEQERVQLHGFVRAQYEARNDHKGNPYNNERTNNRFFLNLQADLKVNENWKGHFQIEANNRWRQNNNSTSEDYGHTRSADKNDGKDWGTIQRVWLTGDFKNGLQIDAGRHWTFLGNNFTMLGAETTGIDVSYPITKNGLRAGAFWKQLSEYDNADFSFYGARLNGPVGHNFDISLAYAHISDGSDPSGTKAAPYYIPQPDSELYGGNWTGKNAFLLGFGTNVAKNLRLSADYVRTDWSPSDNPKLNGKNVSRGHRNQSFRMMLDYKWTNPDVVGSFGAFAGYHYLGANGSIFPDENDGAIKRNSRGWQVGFRYVPWKHVVWETKFVRSKEQMLRDGDYWANQPYSRNLFRTQFDYIF